MRKRVKIWAVRGCLVVFSSLLALAFLELGLRLMIPRSNADLFTYDPHSKRSRVMKAGYEGIVHGVPIALNPNGFRDASATASFPPKEQDEFRAVVLGDSFTVCAGVPWEDLYTSQLQGLLQKERRDKEARRVRVFNLAVAGYNLLHYQHTLDEAGLGLKPDLIVVANYVPNDFEMADCRRYEAIAQGKLGVSQEPQRKPLYLEQAFGPQWWRVRSAITGLVSPSPPPGAAPSRPSFGPDSDGWDENINAMKEISRLAESHHIPLLVILLPHTSNFQGQTQHHETVAQAWKKMGLHCHDTLPAFIAAGVPPQLYRLNLIDSHPNARYNTLVANELARIIRDDPKLSARLDSHP